MKETRWAIVGTGYIANEFAKGMQEAAAAELVAVVSRSEENGKTFAQRYGCDTVYTEQRCFRMRDQTLYILQFQMTAISVIL